MAVKHIGELEVSDLKTKEIEELATELRPRVTRWCFLDNYAGPSAKEVYVIMETLNGTSATFYEPYLGPGVTARVDLRPLELRVASVTFRWRVRGGRWHTNGVSTTPGQFFEFFGIRWDQQDNDHLILP